MAHVKAGGSTKNGRDSNAKRLGVKVFSGMQVKKGNIIVRQKGTKFFPGENTMMGKDYTIFAISDGIVNFTQRKMTKFSGNKFKDFVISVKKS